MEIRDLVKGALIAGAVIGAGGELAYGNFVEHQDLDGIISDAATKDYGNLSVAWGDYNNNGYLDMATVSRVGLVRLKIRTYKNNQGTFSLDQEIDILMGSGSYHMGLQAEVKFADINSDGNLELILSAQNRYHDTPEKYTRVYRYNGSQFVEFTGHNLPNGFGAFALGDINGNGHLDMAILSESSGPPTVSMEIYENNGSGSFSIKGGTYGATKVAYSSDDMNLWGGFIKMGDLDNDGDLDIVFASWSAQNGYLRVLKNNGSGGFTTYTSELPSSVIYGNAALGDMNNNGRLDLVLMGYYDGGTRARVYWNDGNGAFPTFSNLPLSHAQGTIALGDVNGNGYLDVMISGNSGYDNTTRRTRLYINNGGGSFSTVSTFLNVGGGVVSLADINNNGKLDLVEGGRSGSGNVCRVYTNNFFAYDQNIPEISVPSWNTVVGIEPTESVKLSWPNITAHSYEISIGTSEGAGDLLTKQSPMINSTIGMGPIPGGRRFHIFRPPQEGTYYYRLRTVNSRYQRSYWEENSIRVIYRPTDLEVSQSGTSINLQWKDNSSLLLYEYVVYKKSESGGQGYQELVRLPKNAESYTDEGITEIDKYYYKVALYDTVSGQEVYSDEDSIDLRVGYEKPDLELNYVYSGLVKFSWDTHAEYEEYAIERSLDGENWVTLTNATNEGVRIEYTDIPPSDEGNIWHYRVGGVEAPFVYYSDELTINLEEPVYGKPEIKDINTELFPAISFLWNEIPKCDGYIIQRSSDGNIWATLATNDVNATNFQESPGVSLWYYRVGAIYGEYVAYGSVLIADLNNPTQDIDEIRNLKLTAYSDRMFLQWEDYSIREDGFRVWRSIDSVNFTNIVLLPENTASYLDEELESHKWYWYKVEMVEMGSIATNISGENETNIVTNYNVLSTSSVESNFTGNVKMQVTSLRFNGNRDDIGVEFEVFDADGDNLKGLRLYYRVGDSDWISGTIEGDDSFLPKTSYSIVWKSKEDLLYNGKVLVRLEVFDGFEWSYSGEYELIIRNGASGDIEYATIPDIAGSGDIFRVTDMVSGSVVSLYDIRGKLVRHLEVGDDGVFSWNMTNEGGMRVPVGYYVMIIEADGKRRRKVIFVVQ